MFWLRDMNKSNAVNTGNTERKKSVLDMIVIHTYLYSFKL